MNNVYLKNVGSILTGTVISQVIPILGTLILARQFTPSAFGIYSTWLGIALFIAVIITCRFETVLAIEPDGEPRKTAVINVLTTTLVSTTILLFIVIGLHYLEINSIKGLNLEFLALAIIAALLIATIQTLQTWLASDGLYKKLSIIRIIQAGAIVLLQICYSLINQDAISLIISHISGLLIGILFCSILMPFTYRKKSFIDIKGSLLQFWKKHYRFPIYSLPADAINSAAGQIPLLIITTKFGTESAGLFALTQRVLGAPIGLLGTAALDVFKRHAASAYRERGECSVEYKQTFKILFTGSALFCTALYFIGPYLFDNLFDERWIDAGLIGLWLLPMFAFRFIASPLSYMVYIAHKQHLDLVWQIALLITTILSLNFIDSFSLSMQLYSAGYAALYIIYLIMSYKFSLGTKN